jgi:dTDP-4-amino-4,6-dideoxygalactose transaminase
MAPRSRLDIGWRDLFFAVAKCLGFQSAEPIAESIESLWDTERANLACLSVRSGLCALLETLQLPVGSEVIVSSLTIRDIVRILEEYGLVAVPVDLDVERLEVRHEAFEACITAKTKAVLIAHVFGSRMPLEGIIATARARRLWVLEDCAQTFACDDFRGNSLSDVVLFSFGPIKTATALGGAIIGFRDRALRDRVAAVQKAWPCQSRREYAWRVGKMMALQALAYRLPFTLFVVACNMLGRKHDELITSSLRGFGRGNLLEKAKRRPNSALLALLNRRLHALDSVRISRRIQLAKTLQELMPSVIFPGKRAANHTHWVIPILTDHPEELLTKLWNAGFDATRGGSSLYAVPFQAGDGSHVRSQASDMIERVVYLPMHPSLSGNEMRRLAELICKFHADHQPFSSLASSQCS